MLPVRQWRKESDRGDYRRKGGGLSAVREAAARRRDKRIGKHGGEKCQNEESRVAQALQVMVNQGGDRPRQVSVCLLGSVKSPEKNIGAAKQRRHKESRGPEAYGGERGGTLHVVGVFKVRPLMSRPPARLAMKWPVGSVPKRSGGIRSRLSAPTERE